MRSYWSWTFVIASSESSLKLPFYLANHPEPNFSIVARQIQAPDQSANFRGGTFRMHVARCLQHFRQQRGEPIQLLRGGRSAPIGFRRGSLSHHLIETHCDRLAK